MQENIEAAGIISKLADLFFKGMDKILDHAIEYQNDMGVLKGVTKIPVSKDDKNYEIVITLAPVKDKENIYLVQCECDGYEDFNDDGLNEKVIKLNKSNIESLNEVIRRLVKANGFTLINDSNEESSNEADESEDAENQDDEHSSDDNVIEADYLWLDPEVTGNDNSNAKEVHITYHLYPAPNDRGAYKLEADIDNPDLPKLNSKTERYEKLKDYIARYEEDNYLEVQYKKAWVDGQTEIFQASNVMQSNAINVTLQKITSSEGVDINLVAIKSSDVIRAARIVAEIAEDDEFINAMPEGDSSYAILDENDEYDVEPIDSVDTSDTVNELFKAAVSFRNNIISIGWKLSGLENSGICSIVGDLRWNSDSDCDRFAGWISEDYQRIPNVGEVNTAIIDLSVIESDEDIINAVNTLLNGYIDTLDTYYVNLEHDRQYVIDQMLSSYKPNKARLEKALN